MKKLILLGAVLAGTAHAQMYMNSEYGSPAPTLIQPGQTTVYTDRYGQPIATAIQQPQQQPTSPPNYSIYSPSQYTPTSIAQEQQYDRYQQQRNRYGN
jgi:hypothetical protein